MAWLGSLLAAALLAQVAVRAWAGALVLGGPVLYGEGAVANAARLLGGGAYGNAGGENFVAANYPPLYLWIAGLDLGDAFLAGRVASITATVAVGGVIAWRGRASPLVAAALGIGWIAAAPVALWGAALKPDLVAVALTIAGVVLIERRQGLPAGAALVLAVFTKPTALLPALALIGWVAARDRPQLRRLALGLALGAAACLAVVVALGPAAVWRHVVTWNALPWSLGEAAAVAYLALATVGVLAVAAVLVRGARGPVGAYLVAALGIMLLGGREGATINYLLDLAAASLLALAVGAPRLRRSVLFPVAAVLQLAVATLVLDPHAILPDRRPTTGAWGDPARIAAARAALPPGPILAEDSGLLLAAGRTPVIDDLFLWSRLVSRHEIDPAPILAAVASGRYAAVLSAVDLERLDEAAAFERARWDPALAAAIRARYALAGRLDGPLYLYRPR
ncbi:MAG TPA: hypothetical protein VM070_07365 [Candidatus Saccharimonadales bacterium]|nr:hypothetical protein [Candidatus Saccharimonadales bacterium]